MSDSVAPLETRPASSGQNLFDAASASSAPPASQLTIDINNNNSILQDAQSPSSPLDADSVFTVAYVRAFSPRSKEACARQGIQPDELVFKPLHEFLIDGVPEKIAMTRFQYANRHRRDLLQLVRKEHQHLSEINWKPRAAPLNNSFIMSPTASHSSPTRARSQSPKRARSQSPSGDDFKSDLLNIPDTELGVDSGALQLEQQRLEKLLYRQHKELEQMISYELKIAELNEKQETKLKIRKEREEALREEQRLHRRMVQEKKRMFELKKAAEVQEEERRNKQLAYEFMMKQRKFEEEEAEREARRKEMARLKQEERSAKQRAIADRTRAIVHSQMEAIQAKVQYMSDRDRERHEKLEALKREMAMKQANKSREAKERVLTALESNEKLLDQKRQELQSKMREQHERMTRFQETTKERIQELREEHNRKEARRREAREAAAMEEQRKIEQTNSKIGNSDDRKRRLDEEKKMELFYKHELDRLNKQEKLANVRRMQRMDEYRRQQMIQKMNAEAERSVTLEERKRLLIEERKRNQILASMEKERVMKMFQKLKNHSGGLSASSSLQSLTGNADPSSPLAALLSQKSTTDLSAQSVASNTTTPTHSHPNSAKKSLSKSSSTPVLPKVQGATPKPAKKLESDFNSSTAPATLSTSSSSSSDVSTSGELTPSVAASSTSHPTTPNSSQRNGALEPLAPSTPSAAPSPAPESSTSSSVSRPGSSNATARPTSALKTSARNSEPISINVIQPPAADAPVSSAAPASATVLA